MDRNTRSTERYWQHTPECKLTLKKMFWNHTIFREERRWCIENKGAKLTKIKMERKIRVVIISLNIVLNWISNWNHPNPLRPNLEDWTYIATVTKIFFQLFLMVEMNLILCYCISTILQAYSNWATGNLLQVTQKQFAANNQPKQDE